MKSAWLIWPCLACGLAAALPLAAAPPQAPARIVLLDDAEELRAALAARSPSHDVAVRAAGIALPGADPSKTQLLVLAEIDPGQDPGSLASVSYIIENELGQVVTQALRRRELPAGPSGRLLFSEAVPLPPGSYRLKLGAMRNNRIGTAEGALAVRLSSAGPLRFGDLVAGEAAGRDFASSLAFDRRIRGDQLVVSVAVAGEQPAQPQGLSMTVEIGRTEAGAPLVSTPAALLPGTGAVHVAQAVLDVRSLPRGDYVVRLVASAGEGDGAARISTPVSIEPGRGPRGAEVAGRRGVNGEGASRGGAKRGVSAAAAFRPEDVLDPAVLKPFLDDLAERAPEASSKAAIDQARAGRFAEAVKAAPSGRPNDPVRPFLQGLSLFSDRQLQAASEAFRETLRAAPDYFVGSFYIGACYAAGGSDPEAVNAWQMSLVGLDQYPIVFRLLGEALVRTGQVERAIATLDEAHAKWPEDGAVTLQLARAALEARRYDRVIQLADSALAHPGADLLFVGMQAVFEQSSAQPGGRDQAVERIKRYRDLYVSAGGTRRALAAEWVSALEKR